MARIDYLKRFDKRQLFRFFVDGRFHKKYDGWVKYNEREKGSIQAMMNGFSFMMDNLHRQENGLNAMYLLQEIYLLQGIFVNLMMEHHGQKLIIALTVGNLWVDLLELKQLVLKQEEPLL